MNKLLKKLQIKERKKKKKKEKEERKNRRYQFTSHQPPLGPQHSYIFMSFRVA